MKKLFFLILAAFICAAACGKKENKTQEPWHKNTDFMKSVQLSDFEGVNGIIHTSNIDLNAPDKEGRAALHYAIENTENEKIISAIAKADKTDLTAKDGAGYVPLALAAAKNSSEEVFLALLIAGAKPENEDYNALLDYAYKNTNIKIASTAGRLINKTPWYENAAFIEALQKGDYNALERELPFTDLQASSPMQKTTLMYMAIMGDNKYIIALLAKYGADINQYIYDAQKVTPLHYAAASRPLAMIDALIKAGANVNLQDINGFTPLIIAAKMHPESYKIVSLLLKAKADVNVSDGAGNTALAAAARSNEDRGVVLALIQAGADVNAKNNMGDTPLSLAAAYNKNEQVVQALINEKAEVNIANNAGFTPLAAAAVNNENEKIIQALISAEADLNAKTPENFTPLMLAVASNPNENVAQMLLNAGADRGDLDLLLKYAQKNKNPAVKDVISDIMPRTPEPESSDVKESPQSKNAWYNNNQFIAAIQKSDAKAFAAVASDPKKAIDISVMLNGKRGVSALMYAIAHTQNEEIIQMLVDAGLDVNAANENGDTALTVAALLTKNPKIIELLIKAGADVNAKDFEGATALIQAAANNPEEAVLNALITQGADTKNIGALLDAASKNKNPKILEILQNIH
jgi:serine/threonine-protein phosphatase 6 regulatory ankyrin repeat subunit B